MHANQGKGKLMANEETGIYRHCRDGEAHVAARRQCVQTRDQWGSSMDETSIITDVAVMKRHQRLDEIYIFLPTHPENQQCCLQENFVRCMLYESHVYIYNKHILIAQDCIKF